MANSQYSYRLENKAEEDNRKFVKMVILSVVCHLLVCIGVIYTPNFGSHRRLDLTAIRVDLVNLSPSPLGGKPGRKGKRLSIPKTEAVKTPPKEAPKKVEQKASVSSPPPPPQELPKEPPKSQEKVKPKEPVSDNGEKVSLAPKKKKSVDSQATVKKAIERIKEKVENSSAQKISNAIEKIREETEAAEQEGKHYIIGPSLFNAEAGDEEDGDEGMGGTSADPMDVYHATIWHQIRQQWAWPEQLAREHPNLEAVVIVKIVADGHIEDIWFEEKSGNSLFDDSILRALNKSDPLTQLPPGYRASYYEVGFRFNLSEMQESIGDFSQ
ncbi:MAG: cell envelope integrity protein TolA [Pseudomonadota bacterium]